jgi:hypothetical protein
MPASGPIAVAHSRADALETNLSDRRKASQFVDTVDIHRRRTFVYDRPVLNQARARCNLPINFHRVTLKERI